MQKEPRKWQELGWNGCLPKQKNKWQPLDRWGKQKKAISTVDSEKEEDERDNTDEQEQEGYDAMDVDGSGEEQLDRSDEDDGDMEF